MVTALEDFTQALTDLLRHASVLAGAPAKWKDADLVLRHALPAAIRSHLTVACVAEQKLALPACLAECLPDAAWWRARGFVASWRRCHAGLEEFLLPLRRGSDFFGTLLIGPWGTGERETGPDRPRVEAVAAWAADCLLWQLERRESARLGARQGHGRHPAVQRAMALLLADARRDRGLAALAKEVGMSSTRLTHLWRQETGRSFTAWREVMVRARALRLLAAADLSIGVIAETCGYADAAHFAGAFKRWTGGSPTAYRKQFFSETP